mmetsp:Transcript_8598/g.26871  ORF Transcript_8598/g.26871 Transcript_8598/m.26871 type:complete len:254 (+) Transcript_8598:351-1112(+)
MRPRRAAALSSGSKNAVPAAPFNDAAPEPSPASASLAERTQPCTGRPQRYANSKWPASWRTIRSEYVLSAADASVSASAPLRAKVSTAASPAVARNNGCGESRPSAFAAAISAPQTMTPRIANIRPAPSFGLNAASVRSPASRAISSSDAPCDSGKGSSIAIPKDGASPRRRSAWYARTSLASSNAAANCSPSLLSGVTAAALSSAAIASARSHGTSSSSTSTTASTSLPAIALSSGVRARRLSGLCGRRGCK